MKLIKKKTFSIITLSASLFFGINVTFPSYASWLSDMTGVNINVPDGTITTAPPKLPTVPGRSCEALGVPCIDVGKEAERVLREIQAQGFSPTMEAWLIQSRNDAIRAGTAPIPLRIRQQLDGFYDQDVLNRTLYKIGDNGILNLGRLAIFRDGNIGFGARAITLVDVIVFNNPADVNDPVLWAHELMHVKQYRDWGIRDFTIRYLRDPIHDRNPVENEAREAERASQQYSYQSYQY